MSLFGNLLHSLRLSKFRGERATFYEQLAKSIEVRESFEGFLEAELRISAAKATRDSSRAYALRCILRRLGTGSATHYSQSLSTVMPAGDRLVLAALDSAPDKAEMLRRVARLIRGQAALLKMVKQKALIPLLVLPGVFVFAWVLATKSIPLVVKLAPAEVWTPFNMAVRVFAESIANYGVPVAAAVAAGAVLFGYQISRWTGTLRARLEGLHPRTGLLLFPVAPFLLPLSAYRDFQAGMVFSSLAVLLQSGATLKEALMTLQRNAQPWLRWQVRRIVAHLEANPTEYQQAFARGLVSPSLLARLSSSIRTTPHFDDVLIKLGDEGLGEVTEHVQKQASLINGLMLGVAALVLSFLVLGNLSITNTMSDEMSPSRQLARTLKAQNAAKAIRP